MTARAASTAAAVAVGLPMRFFRVALGCVLSSVTQILCRPPANIDDRAQHVAHN